MTLKRLVELDRGPERVVNITNHIKTHSPSHRGWVLKPVLAGGIVASSVFLYGNYIKTHFESLVNSGPGSGQVVCFYMVSGVELRCD